METMLQPNAAYTDVHPHTGKNNFSESDYFTGHLASASHVQWVWSSFEELNIYQLYEALRLRESIFIVEQDVPYIDIDGKDKHCIHLMGYVAHEMVAYMRIVPLDLFEAGYFSLGRVVVRPDLRGTGIGREMVRTGIAYLDKIRDGHPIKISSQLYLKKFYASFGFVAQGEPYLEDRIPHIAMVRAN